MSRNTDNTPFQGQPKTHGRGSSMLPHRGGSSAGMQRAAYGEAPARTYSGTDGRGPARWPTEATAALLNATKLGLREQGEELSSDDDELPRWNVGKRSGGPGAGRGQIDRAASGTLPQRQPEPPAPRMWPVTLPTLPLRGASAPGRGRGGPPAPPRAWGVPPAGYTGTYAPDASARPGASPPGGPLNLEAGDIQRGWVSRTPVSPPMAEAAAAVAAQSSASGLVHVPIICNGNRGRFLLEHQSCICHCKLCAQRAQRSAVPYHEMTPTEFERHSGMAASKKWKYTLRVDKPEAKSCTLGAYLDQLGVLEKSGRSGSGRFIQAAASAVAAAAANTGSIQPLQQPVPGPPEPEDGESTPEPDNDPGQGGGPGYLADSVTDPIHQALAEAEDRYGDAQDDDGDAAAAAAAALVGAQREAKAATARPLQKESRPRGRPRGGGRRGRGRGRGRGSNRSRSITPEGLTPEPGYGDGDNGQVETPPELGAVDAVLNLSRDKWLKPSPAYNRQNRKPAIREGPQYQAVVPQGPPRPRPTGSEEDDPRSGTRGPTPEEMRAIAAGAEVDAANALPPDARTDNDSIVNVNGKTVLLQRGQRARKRPVWLANTVDPHLADPNRLNRPQQRPFSPLRYNGVESSELESQQYGSDTSGANNGAAPHRRKRNVAAADFYGGGYHNAAYAAADDSLPVPKRVRTTQRDAGATWRPAGSAAEASPSPRTEAGPEVLSWQLLEPQLLFILVNYQDYQFAGTLMLEARDHRDANQADLSAPALPGALMEVDESHPGGLWAEDEAQGLGASTAPSNITAPETEIEGVAAAEAAARAPAGPASVAAHPAEEDGGEVQSHTEVVTPAEGDKKEEKVKGNPARRAAAAAEYLRLARSGAPPGTRCALCHKEQEANEFGEVSLQRGLGLTPDAATNRGLGPLLLVKVSAIANAWVHSQCAVWSPEVYESSEGKLEQVGLAVRRGRMIKCRFCGHRGATLGCHIRSCRTSFHLPCARYNGSRLDGNGRVTCPLHVHLVESEPIIPVPEPEHYDDETDDGGGGGGRHGHGNDRDAPSEETHLDGDDGGGDVAAGGRGQSNGGQGGSRQRGASQGPQGRQRAVAASPEDDEEFSDEEEEEIDDDDNQYAEAAGGAAKRRRVIARRYQGYITEPPNVRPSGRAMPRPPGTARERYETLLADADNVSRAEFSRFGGTVGRSMFRPGRCAVCVEQRKGKCGTNSAPKRCLRRQHNALQLRAGRRPVGRPRRVVDPPAPTFPPERAGNPWLVVMGASGAALRAPVEPNLPHQPTFKPPPCLEPGLSQARRASASGNQAAPAERPGMSRAARSPGDPAPANPPTVRLAPNQLHRSQGQLRPNMATMTPQEKAAHLARGKRRDRILWLEFKAARDEGREWDPFSIDVNDPKYDQPPFTKQPAPQRKRQREAQPQPASTQRPAPPVARPGLTPGEAPPARRAPLPAPAPAGSGLQPSAAAAASVVSKADRAIANILSGPRVQQQPRATPQPASTPQPALSKAQPATTPQAARRPPLPAPGAIRAAAAAKDANISATDRFQASIAEMPVAWVGPTQAPRQPIPRPAACSDESERTISETLAATSADAAKEMAGEPVTSKPGRQLAATAEKRDSWVGLTQAPLQRISRPAPHSNKPDRTATETPAAPAVPPPDAAQAATGKQAASKPEKQQAPAEKRDSWAGLTQAPRQRISRPAARSDEPDRTASETPVAPAPDAAQMAAGKQATSMPDRKQAATAEKRDPWAGLKAHAPEPISREAVRNFRQRVGVDPPDPPAPGAARAAAAAKEANMSANDNVRASHMETPDSWAGLRAATPERLTRLRPSPARAQPDTSASDVPAARRAPPQDAATFAAQARAVAAGAPISEIDKSRHAAITTFADEWRAMATAARAKAAGSPRREPAGPAPAAQPPILGMTPLPERANLRPMVTTMPPQRQSNRPMVTTLPARYRTPAHAATTVTTMRHSSSGTSLPIVARQPPATPPAADAAHGSQSGAGASAPAQLSQHSADKASESQGTASDKQAAEDAGEARGEDSAHAWHLARSPSKGAAVVA